MFARGRDVSAFLSNFFHRKRQERRRWKKAAAHRGRTFHMEGLERREMFAVGALYFTAGGVLHIDSTNTATSVTVSHVGSTYRITDNNTNKTYDYAEGIVKSVDFKGGSGNDTFINNVYSLPVHAVGNDGNDHLEGYNGSDTLEGGNGNDTLLGFGGNDNLWGGAGNDVIKGEAGSDYIYGEAGDDYLDGSEDVDVIFGADGNDTILGGNGNDYLYGDRGNDHINGQGGADTLSGSDGDDVLIAIDAAFADIITTGIGNDVVWRDLYSPAYDKVNDASSSDLIQNVPWFSNGADLTLNGDNIADPSDAMNKVTFTNTITADKISGTNPLFSSYGQAVRSSDPDQNALNNCWLISGLSTIADRNPQLITRNVVDFNDGTYGVNLGGSFFRVDAQLPVNSMSNGATSSNLTNARLGADNSLWVAIVEKAFAAYRSASHTYGALNNGGSYEVFNAFGMKDLGDWGIKSIYGSATYMANDFANRMVNGYSQTVTVYHNNGQRHVFSVYGFVRNSAGAITDILLRNPTMEDQLDQFNSLRGATSFGNANDGIIAVPIGVLYNATGSWTNWAHA